MSKPAIPLISGLSGFYCRFKTYAAKLQSLFLLAVRLCWGWQFTETGWGKLHNLAHVRDYFASLGIPSPGLTAPAVASLEFIGGVLLIVGLASRLAGFLLAGNMLVAYITADREALTSIFNNFSKFYSADPFTFLFASLIVLVFGAGIFSLDYYFARKRVRRT